MPAAGQACKKTGVRTSAQHFLVPIDSMARLALEDGAAADEAAPPRRAWSSNSSFILASIGSAVGFGNIWRFPKLAHKYGGGAFLIPYSLAWVFCAVPVVVLEFSLGQRFQASHVNIIRQLHPRAVGLGWAGVIGTFLLVQFYNALLGITLCYLIVSFSPNGLPWTNGPRQIFSNETLASQSLAHTFFVETIVQPSGGVDDFGGLVPHLAAAYAAIWLIVAASASRSSASIELLNWIVTPIPFVVLTVFFFRGVTLEGAGTGIAAFLSPDYSHLWGTEVWMAAVGQLFFGVSAGLGTLTTYASYTPKETPIVRSAIIVCCANSAYEILCGFTVFAYLGHLSHLRGVPVDEVVVGGTSLAFEVFPVAFSSLPAPQLWSILFFLMLLNLGISSAVSMTSPLSMALVEACLPREVPSRLTVRGSTSPHSLPLWRRGLNWITRVLAGTSTRLTLSVHFFGFCGGLIYVTRAGLYWIDLSDHFVPLYLTVVVSLSECLLVSLAYGEHRLIRELARADQRWERWWAISWRYNVPCILTVLMLANSYSEYVTNPFGRGGDVTYPAWVLFIGTCLAFGPMLLLPICYVDRVRDGCAQWLAGGVGNHRVTEVTPSGVSVVTHGGHGSGSDSDREWQEAL